jgi:hypothetical protein
MAAILHPSAEAVRTRAQGRSVWATAMRRYRALFAIDLSEAGFAVRGFTAGREAQCRLEDIGETFLRGFNLALVEDDTETLQLSVERVEPDRRGFAVEGAAMGAAVADALMLGGSRLARWTRYNNSAYTYLAHVGAGWALARVPWRRAAILRSCDAIHGWLVFDGLGFHDAYFASEKILGGWRRLTQPYACRVYDQGVGRALWFVAGGEIDRAITAITRFDSVRRSDLWSGLGLAMTYAGGASPAALAQALAAAGTFRADFAQGAAFAAEAHARANHIPAHTREAVMRVTGRDAIAAAELVRTLRAQLPAGSGNEPAYEQWRRDIRQALAPQ